MSGLPQVNIPTDPTADEDHAGLALAATLRAVADDVELRIKVVPGRYSDEWITERYTVPGGAYTLRWVIQQEVNPRA